MKPLSNIQVLRGLAALGVLIYHAVGMVIYGGGPVPPLPNLEWGAFGVDVFFVVSGFIMPYASVRDFGSRGSVLPFIGRRLVRVVPLYWLATLAFALMSLRGLEGREEIRHLWQSTLRALVFVPEPDGDFGTLPTGWTLYYEMFFYVLFAAVLPFRRRPAIAGLGAVLLAFFATGAAGVLPTRISGFGASQLLEFLAGMAIAEARLSGWRVPARIGYPVAALALVAVMPTAPLSDALTPWRGIVWGVPAALIGAALALAPEPAGPSGRVRRALEYLGDASYSIYLTHFPLYWFIGIWLFWLTSTGPHHAQLYCVMLATVGLPVSLLVHRFVERPLLRLMRGRRKVAVWQAPRPATPGPGTPSEATAT